MGEPLKNSFGADVPRRIAERIAAVDETFDGERFVDYCLDGYDALELTPRAHRIADGLARCLAQDRARALDTIIASLGPELEGEELTGMEAFFYLPHVFFVAEHGLDHFDRAIEAQYELTKRFTAEFSIRAYLEHDQERTLEVLHRWTRDPNPHVRRLVSEGSRPRLPWARRLRGFQDDPAPVLELLERLRNDPAEYVRRSVANNLNDIAKDHPDAVVAVARRWWSDADRNGRRMIRHALRTLVKAGDAGALAVLGYEADSPVEIAAIALDPAEAAIGGSVTVTLEPVNPSDGEARALIDIRVHFVKANGSTAPKVFKGAEIALAPGERTTVRTRISLRQHSTRTHYPGRHPVEVLINGVAHEGGAFVLRPA